MLSRMGTRKKSTADNPYSGPYKATRLWNDVISAFRENIPCGRHRRLMRTFDNCFSGSSAIDWLLQYLRSNENFGSDVKREKATSLLNKLYSAGIFEEVKVTRTMQHKNVVQENRLYRVLPVSPSKLKMTRLPLAPRNDVGFSRTALYPDCKKNNESKKDKYKNSHPKIKDTSKSASKTNVSESLERENKYPSCRIVPKVLTNYEISEVWKRTIIYKMRKALSVTRLADIMSDDLINGSFVMHNCVFLNKNGTVTNIPPSDQLPQWVLSAMKCLARWPEHHEEGLPSYPGFEKDVFGVVKDYFLGLKEPLIPFQLYDAITNIFVMASSRSSNQSDIYASKERESIVKRLWTTASLENIILDLSKKYSLLSATGNQYENESLYDANECFEAQDNSHFMSNDNDMYESKPDIRHKDSFYTRRPHRSQLSRSTNSSSGLLQRKCNTLPMRKFGSTPNLKISKYETAFGPDNRTVTRVFYQNGVCTDYKHCGEEEEHDSFSPIETHFSASTEDLVHHEYPVNFQRVGSLELIHFNECQRKSNMIPSKNMESLQRSKSFASRPRSRSDAGDIGTCHSYHSKEDIKNSLHHMQSDIYGLRKSVEDESDSYPWASQESLTIGDRLSPVPELVKKDGQPPHNSFITKHISTGSMYSLQRNNSFYQASACLTQHNVSHSSMKDDQDYAKLISTPPSFHSTTSLHHCKDSSRIDSINYGPGYRPVLDASKERSSSTTNLYPQSYYPLQTKPSSTLDRNSHRMTSTPLSPVHGNKTNYFGRLQSCTSLTDFTPFYASQERRDHVSRGNDFMSYPQTRLSEERAKNCLQLFTLLMSPGNRRKLHMLFKLMVKMAANPNLCLDSSQTTRSLVLGTFYRSIICSEKESDLDETLVLQLLSFMLDYYDDIFTPPSDIKSQVSERLKQMQRPQISYSPGPGPPTSMQYCRKISATDFENEKNVVSRQAMEELLENITKDAKMSIKEKCKRLKQFQITYPTIYKKRFPTQESEAEVLHATSKPKLKPPLVIKPINRLKGLRL